MKNIQFQRGMSLVEILVSLVISLFLLGGVVQVYLGNQTSYKFANALSQVQENGRFALETMVQDLRASGDWGCINFDADEPFDPVTYNIGDRLLGTPGYNAAIHDFIGNAPIQGTNNIGGLGTSDTITINGTKVGQVNVIAPFSPPASQFINTNAIDTIGAGDIVLITRCGSNDLLVAQEADIFRVDNVVPGTNPLTQRRINHSATLSQQYENDATIVELQSVTYLIANGASGQPALIRSEFGNNQELIEGIQDMQILYGVDSGSDGYANQYLTSNNVVNFDDVVSIRVMLLVRSTDNTVTDQFQTYTFNGIQTTAADNRLYQVFSSTIALRNRVGLD